MYILDECVYYEDCVFPRCIITQDLTLGVAYVYPQEYELGKEGEEEVLSLVKGRYLRCKEFRIMEVER